MTSSPSSHDAVSPLPGVYQIVNVTNGHRYIGSATNLAQRCAEHSALLAKGKHTNPHIQRSYTLYGASSFKFFVLEYTDDSENPRDVEQRYLSLLWDDGDKCYNIAKDAYAPFAGRKHSASTIEKLKAKVNSAETRKKMGAWQLGRTLPDATKQKIRLAHLGSKHTEEAKKKVSASLIGNSRRKGIPHSAETKKKIGLSSRKRQCQQQI